MRTWIDKTGNKTGNWGISFDGDLLSFTLCHDTDPKRWYLSRADIANIANGDFDLKDCRGLIVLDKDESEWVQHQATNRAKDIASNTRMMSFCEYPDYFREHIKRYAPLTLADLGRVFYADDWRKEWVTCPLMVYGARPKARSYKIECRNLVTGDFLGARLEYVAERLGYLKGVQP